MHHVQHDDLSPFPRRSTNIELWKRFALQYTAKAKAEAELSSVGYNRIIFCSAHYKVILETQGTSVLLSSQALQCAVNCDLGTNCELQRACLQGGWIGLCSVLRPRQHSTGYMGDGFYRSKDLQGGRANSLPLTKLNVAAT